MTDATPGLRSYRPGDWYAVLGDRVAVLLPPSERHRVAALWELVDGGADADEVLDALIAGGLRSLPAFVLLADVGDRVRIVLRGPARAGIDTFDGPVALDGTDATTWVERVLPDVTAVRVDVADRAEGADRLIEAGLVRIGRLDRPPHAETAPEPVPRPVPVPDLVVEPEPELEPEPEPEPVEEQHEPVAALVEMPGDEEPADQPTEAIDLSELHDAPDLPDLPDLSAPPVPPPAPWAPTPVPAVPSVGGLFDWEDDTSDGQDDGYDDSDHDGTTRTPGPGDDDGRDQQGVTSRPVARLTFSAGDVVDVDRVVLVGRSPEARRFSASDQPRLVTVSSPHQEISSTHLEIRPGSGIDHGSAVVTDLGSTNGTVLVQPGLPPEVLDPGVAVQLLPGAVVDLGDGVTIRVSHP